MSTSISPSSTVAANVRAEVARQRIAQVVIAERLGLPQSGVSRRLRGLVAFSLDELGLMAELLGVPVTVLLDGVDVKAERVEAAS